MQDTQPFPFSLTLEDQAILQLMYLVELTLSLATIHSPAVTEAQQCFQGHGETLAFQFTSASFQCVTVTQLVTVPSVYLAAPGGLPRTKVTISPCLLGPSEASFKYLAGGETSHRNNTDASQFTIHLLWGKIIEPILVIESLLVLRLWSIICWGREAQHQ